MPPSSRTVGPRAIALLWVASLGAYLLTRWALNSAYGLPVVGPGLLSLTAILLAASWALVEELDLALAGKRALGIAWLGGLCLLVGESLIYGAVEGKDRLAPLALACFGAGALCFFPPQRGRTLLRRLAAPLAGILAGLGLWAWRYPSRSSMDLVAGPAAGEWPPILVWVLAAFFVLILLITAHRSLPEKRSEAPLRPHQELWLLLAVLALGALIRFPQMGKVPDGIWYDELNLSRATEDRVLKTDAAPLYVAEQVENPGAYLWVGAAVYKAFGVGITPYRYLAAIFGLLALIPFWALARLWFGPRWALAATALYGTMRWTLIPQRIGFMSGFALFWMLAAFWALWSARLRGGAWRWLLAGLLAGCNLHTYTPGRLVPVIVGAWLLLELLFDAKQRRGALRSFGLMALGFLLSAGPMLWYIATHWDIYALRSAQVSIFTDAAKSGRPVFSELWTTFSKHLLMFHLRGDFNARHNLHFYPHVDLLSASGLALALPYALGRFFKDPRSRFLTLWLGAMLSAGIFTLAVEAPQGHRTILAAPVLALALIWAGRDLLGPLGRSFTKGWPQAGVAAGLALLLSVAAFNAYEVFGVWGPNSETWRSFSPFATAVERRARRSPADEEVRLSPLPNEYQFHGFEQAVFTQYFLRQQGRSVEAFKRGTILPAPLGPPPRALLLIWGESDKDVTDAFAQQYPGIPVEAPTNPYPVIGEPSVLYFAAEIPWDRIPLLAKAPPGFILARGSTP